MKGSWQLDSSISGLTQLPLDFFSSRRRHTRLQGDLSSDVCSSDLAPHGGEGLARHRRMDHPGERALRVADRDADAPLREPVEEVDGPIERVHNPAQTARSTLVGALLLAEEGVLGPSLREQ